QAVRVSDQRIAARLDRGAVQHDAVCRRVLRKVAAGAGIFQRQPVENRMERNASFRQREIDRAGSERDPDRPPEQNPHIPYCLRTRSPMPAWSNSASGVSIVSWTAPGRRAMSTAPLNVERLRTSAWLMPRICDARAMALSVASFKLAPVPMNWTG